MISTLFGIDLRSLALFRICLGLLLVLDMCVRSLSIEAHYTDMGVLPRSLLFYDHGYRMYWCVHCFSGRWEWQALLLFIQGLFGLALLVGYRTRIVTIISWYLLTSLNARNFLLLQAGDLLVVLLLFWSMFLPLGARWSLDSTLTPHSEPLPNRVVSGGSAALLLQVAFVYWFAVIFKWNHDWLSGEAAAYALYLDSFATSLGVWLRQYGSLLPIFSYATLALEFLCPTVAFSPFATAPCRMAAVTLAVLMHIGFGIALYLGFFVFTSIISWLVFIPGEFWDRVQGKTSTVVAITSSKVLNLIALCLIAYVLAWNIRTLNYNKYDAYYPNHFGFIGRVLHLEQMWNMFYIPTRSDGWFVVPAELLNGQVVDLYRNGAPLSWERPALVSSLFPDQRWRKYMLNLVLPAYKDYIPYYARYMCRSWNRRHERNEEVKALQVVFMMHQIYRPNQIGDTTKFILWNERCQK